MSFPATAIKVLSIEDSSFYQEVIRKLLEGLNIEITFCESIAAFKEKVNHSYNVLLVDLNLEDSCGFGTIKEVINYGIPVIILTAHPDVKTADESFNLGAVDYLVKPINRENLAFKIVIAAVHGDKKKISSEIFEEIKKYIS